MTEQDWQDWLKERDRKEERGYHRRFMKMMLIVFCICQVIIGICKVASHP